MYRERKRKNKCNACCRHLLEQIKTIMENPLLDDKTCFQHIEKIVEIFEQQGVHVSYRHDF